MNTKGAVGDISNDERPNRASDTRIKTAIHNASRTKQGLKPLSLQESLKRAF
ncbi:hypothetical protein E5E47_06760 [Helicobacter pylori]|nr:hypothetical protein E5E47_06760 [Helicobacter pylori]